MPTASDLVPPEIFHNPKRYPFFKDALGALDGTHINCSPSAQEREAARNRKGLLTQNCLVACSFDLLFLYVLSGWEGSASDALIFYNDRLPHPQWEILSGRCRLSCMRQAVGSILWCSLSSCRVGACTDLMIGCLLGSKADSPFWPHSNHIG